MSKTVPEQQKIRVSQVFPKILSLLFPGLGVKSLYLLALRLFQSHISENLDSFKLQAKINYLKSSWINQREFFRSMID